MLVFGNKCAMLITEETHCRDSRELCISFTMFSVNLKLTYKQHLFLYTNIERGRKNSVPVAAVLWVPALHISRKHHYYKIHAGGRKDTPSLVERASSTALQTHRD